MIDTTSQSSSNDTLTDSTKGLHTVKEKDSENSTSDCPMVDGSGKSTSASSGSGSKPWKRHWFSNPKGDGTKSSSKVNTPMGSRKSSFDHLHGLVDAAHHHGGGKG